jgi:serine O-acetyltransferase
MTLKKEQLEPVLVIPRRSRKRAPHSKNSTGSAAGISYSDYAPALVDSYRRAGGLNHGDSHNMPSKRAVARICEDLLQIMFPGYHDEDSIHHESLLRLSEIRLTRVAESLENQVRKSVRVGNPKKMTGKTPPILRHFCESLPDIRDLLKTDIEAAFQGDPAAIYEDEIILSYPFVEAITIQRLAHVLHGLGAPIIPRMMTEWAHAQTGIDIHPGAKIGTHFFIDHGTGVVVGETSRIGNGVKLYHGVTLGARSFVKDSTGMILKGGDRHPQVEDRVTIYPNSTILGGETVIGKNSTIGANVFLMHSVPENSLVLYEEKQLVIRNKGQKNDSHVVDWII